MEGTKIEVGELFRSLSEELRRNAAIAGIAVFLLVAGDLALDRLGETASLVPEAILSLGLQLYVTRTALVRCGLLRGQSGSQLWSFWGMTIVTTIGVAVGIVLLVLPGLLLAARWFVAGPAIVAENLSAGEGMRRSRELTKSSIWSIIGAIALLFGCGYGVGMIPLLSYPENNAPIAVTAISYLFIYAASVCAWLMSVGAYELLSQRQSSLAEVFA